MTEKRWLYFALGVTTVISIGAVTNQLAPLASSGVALSEQGIIFPDGTVQTTAALGDTRRAFYLTASFHRGGPTAFPGPLDACAAGFHMASLWEILDVSNLRYATDAEGLGDVHRRDDSGEGPPGAVLGWVRTGTVSYAGTIGGPANCNTWASAETDDFGTSVSLENNWGNPSAAVPPWEAAVNTCDFYKPVWCVEDYPGAASV